MAINTSSSQLPKIAFNESDDDSQNTIIQSKFNHRRRKKTIQWTPIQSFGDKEEALYFLKREQTWGETNTNHTMEGGKIYFRCNQVKKNGPQCNARIHLVFEKNSPLVVLYSNGEHHSCQYIESKNQRLKARYKEEIYKLFHLKFKPKRIYEILNAQGVPCSRSQVNNYVQHIKRLMGSSKETGSSSSTPAVQNPIVVNSLNQKMLAFEGITDVTVMDNDNYDGNIQSTAFFDEQFSNGTYSNRFGSMGEPANFELSVKLERDDEEEEEENDDVEEVNNQKVVDAEEENEEDDSSSDQSCTEMLQDIELSLNSNNNKTRKRKKKRSKKETEDLKVEVLKTWKRKLDLEIEVIELKRRKLQMEIETLDYETARKGRR